MGFRLLQVFLSPLSAPGMRNGSRCVKHHDPFATAVPDSFSQCVVVTCPLLFREIGQILRKYSYLSGQILGLSGQILLGSDNRRRLSN
jgi:hypothetical protein